MSTLEGQTVMVTGASAGIGRAIAVRLGSEGARLILVARREALLCELADTLANEHAEALVQPCDLHSEEQLEELAAFVAEREPPVDVLVNCAGLHRFAPFLVTDPEDWKSLIQVNLVAPMRLGHAFGKRLRRCRRPGCMVNIASVGALVGVPGASAYCATKGALVSWGRALAAEWAKSNIRVITICPGFVRTDMLEQVRRSLPADAMANLEASFPLGFGEPADVAEVVAAAVGPAGRWMTGSVITVDGGYSAL